MLFDTVITAIQAEINDTTAATETRLVRWLNDIHRRICAIRKWPFLIVPGSDEMTIGSADVPYPVSSITFDAAVAHGTAWYPDEVLNVWDVTDSVCPLEKTTLVRLRELYQTTLTESGEPRYWYYSKEVRADATTGILGYRYIDFYPTLSADRKFIFRFTRQQTGYVRASVLKLLVPDKWEHVVFEGVLMKVWRQRGDDRWLDSRESYNKGIEEMKDHYAQSIITGYNPASVPAKTRFPQIVTQS